MEDNLDAQLERQMNKVRWLRAEKARWEQEAREKAECKGREKAECEVRERAEQEAREKEHWDNEFQARFQEEQWRKHEAAAQRVAEAKMLQCQVQMPEASRSRRNGDLDVSGPSPSPAYIRLIWKQAAWVSGSENGRIFLLTESQKQGKAGGVWKGPCGACVICGESCDGCRKWKVACDLSQCKLHGAKVKRKGGSIINSNDDMLGEPELKQWKVDPVPIVEIQQPGGTSLSLFQDLIGILCDHVKEQQKQTTILECIAHVQELDWEDWAFNGSEGLEMGTEGSKEEEGMEESRVQDGNRNVDRVDKGKGKEKVNDGNVDGKKDGTRGGSGNGGMDVGTLQ